MSDKRVTRFLKSYLPQDIAEVIDWECLELQPRSYINDVRESVVDVLSKQAQTMMHFFVCRHQSRADALMPFRMLNTW